MENRSHALLAGLFTLLLLLAAGVVAIWVSKQNLPRVPYELIATSPVTGLSVQSEVRYQGVPVGNVESLRFVPEKPGKVLILIGIDPRTPITRATWAEIVIAGVTGISNVELRDDGTSTTRLESSAAKIQQIPIRPNFLDRLIAQASGMAPAVEGLLVHIQKIASDENIEALSSTLKNVASLSDQLRRSVVLLEPGIAKVPALIDNLSVTGKRVDEAMTDIRKLALSAQKTLDVLNAPGGTMVQMTQSLKDIREAVAQLRVSTLPDVSMLTLSATDASRALTQTARQLGQAPQSLIFGPPRAVPGPGEPGFAGFGATGR
ncbi:MlaD family protein [Zwartia vadi]|uniref:MlaD family protein n=1 Tax=Zwartia vadi TaxID=3058168 RepID=UPI0025B3BA72|nr:MlaD family protein [Zwartia vadi]MDN3987431.1 MlaD family protein [Zwartia vadi]